MVAGDCYDCECLCVAIGGWVDYPKNSLSRSFASMRMTCFAFVYIDFFFLILQR